MSARRPTIDPSSEPPGRWATTVALSMGLHLAGFGLAVALPRLLPRGAQGPPVYVVDLVALPSPGAPGAPPHAAAPPQKKEITRPPAPEKTIKLPERSAKKAKSKPPEPKKPEAKPSPTPAATDRGQEGGTAAAPSPGATPAKAGAAAAGGAGAGAGATAGAGAGQGGQADYYYTYLQGRIYAAWQRPLYPATETLRKSLTTTVRLTLSSSGRVTRAELVSSSGYGAIDQSVLRAVQDAQPFQPIPSSLGRESLTVNLEITLTPN